MNALVEFLAGLIGAIGQRLFCPPPPPEPPAPAPEPPRFGKIDEEIDREIARTKSDPPKP